MELPDVTLLEQARTGDRRALEALLSRHQRRVYRFGLKMCRDPEDAKDVLQETLLAVARSVKDFRGASSVSTWLYTIARSFCIKKRRRSKFAPEQEESLDSRGPGLEARQIVDPGRGPEDELAGRQIEAALEQAIAGLDPMYREVLVLRDVEGLTAPEVARGDGAQRRGGEEPPPPRPGGGARGARAAARRARCRGRALGRAARGGLGSGRRLSRHRGLLFSEHLEGEISASVCADMEQHLSRCPACQSKCDSLQRTLALCRAAPLPEVPKAVQADVRRALQRFIELHQ